MPEDTHEMIPRMHLEEALQVAEGIQTVIVRPGFVYGGTGGVIAKLFFGVDPSSKSVVLYGSADKRWSWVHVDDLAHAYVQIAEAPRSVVQRQVFNIAALGDNPTYKELKLAAARAAGWSGSQGDVVLKQVPPENKRELNWEWNVIINPKKAMAHLGWFPRHVGVVEEIDTYFMSWKANQKV